MSLQRHRLTPLRTPTQRGFTLLEVLVAMTLIGFGLAVAFTAVSGTARTDEKMTAHAAAMVLARAKLDEALASPAFTLANDTGENYYAGTDFGYRVKLSPVLLLQPEQQQLIRTFKQKLERVEIEVFWGPKDAQQSYVLRSYRSASSEAETTSDPSVGRP